MLLGLCASFVDELATLAGALGQLLGLVLDLVVQTFKDGQDGALDGLGCLGMGV